MKMNKTQYLDWCKNMGYLHYSDWNYQTIGRSNYFFIINPNTDKFALICHTPAKIGVFGLDTYKVLVNGWTDFNGWAEEFHKESKNE